MTKHRHRFTIEVNTDSFDMSIKESTIERIKSLGITDLILNIETPSIPVDEYNGQVTFEYTGRAIITLCWNGDVEPDQMRNLLTSGNT